MANVPVSISVTKTLQPDGTYQYAIEFYPDPKDPQPVIYNRPPKKPGSAVLPRAVEWTLSTQLDADMYIAIVPKALNTRIFHATFPLKNFQTVVIGIKNGLRSFCKMQAIGAISQT